MVHLHQAALAFAGLVSAALAQKCATINPAFTPSWGTGFSGRVFMTGLLKPRGLIFDDKNNMLVVERGGGVRWIKMTDNGGTDVCVASSEQLISEQSLNHGIDLSADGKTLFVSSTTTVWAYPYDSTAGTVRAGKTIITGMGTDGHVTRTLLASKKNSDVLIVSVGSNGNIDTATSQKTYGRSQLRTFSIANITQASVEYTAGGVLGWGLRNSVGVTENPVTGGIWSVENSVDDMTKGTTDIHNTNPCEELNYHGILGRTSAETGENYGYPDCFAAWDPSVIPNGSQYKVGTQFAIGTGADSTCTSRIAPKLCFPAHTAPLGVKFNKNNTAAYISFHGSWNRNPPDGYRLSQIEIDPATGMPKEPSTSTTAAINVMSNPNNGDCPSKCFRPLDVVFDNKGRLFMTSDTTGEVWVIGGAV